jgi:TPR repeat protein
LPEEVNSSNLEKGIKYLEKAAQLKYPKAFINLGKCYQNGIGVIENLDRARALFLQGSELGDIHCKL